MDLDSWAFMLFGLGFYLFVIRMIVRDDESRYNRRLGEAREFGFGGKGQHTAKTLNKDKY